MIVVHVRHGRSSTDARRLAVHLLRLDDNAAVEVLPAVGIVADDLPGMLAAMRRLAPRPTSAALHHVALSPAADCSAADLRGDADRVLREVGVDPNVHPHVLVVHSKASAGGRGSLHGHLVFAHWGLDGAPIRDGWIRLRLERIAREVEFDRGEPLTRGRHDKALSRALHANGRADVATALDAIATPEAPKSATTSNRRQTLKRAGVSDTGARAAVKAAWEAARTPETFRAALGSSGLAIRPGAKRGVLLVTTTNGVEVGALDRILRIPREEIGRMMEPRDEPADPAIEPRERNLIPHKDDRRDDDEAPAVARTPMERRGAEPAGGVARDTDRNSTGATADGDAASADRASPAKLADAEWAQRRRRRVQELAASRALAEVIDIGAVKAEVVRRATRPRIVALQQVIARSQALIDQCNSPMPTSAALTAAIARRDRTKATAAKARAKAERSSAIAEKIAGNEPRGIRRLFSWLSGALHRYRASLAKAEAAAEQQRQTLGAMEFIAKGAEFTVDLEYERASKTVAAEKARRKDVADSARETILSAQRATAMLSRDDALAELSVDDCLRRAWTVRRREDAEAARREMEASLSATGPRM